MMNFDMEKRLMKLTPLAIEYALMSGAFPAAMVLVLVGCATPSQISADAEINQLCVIDGGVKVYETVRLPSERFNQWGQIDFYDPTGGENSLGESYVFKRERRWIKKSESESGVTMLRTYMAVYRKADGKLLGESVRYGRGGGDLPGPWHPSNYSCPPVSEVGDIAFLRKLFVAEGGK